MRVNLFVLIPEINPQFNWIRNLSQLIEENNLNKYIKGLLDLKKTILL